jgi:hypothetical protein
VRKKIDATKTRTIAAAEMRISVVELDLAGLLGEDDRDIALTADLEGSAARTEAAGGEGIRVSGTVVCTLLGGTMLDGTAV